MRIYIDDFVEDLNYHKVILYVGYVDPSELRSKLMSDETNHLYRFTSIIESNSMFFIENCDLQDVDTEHSDEFGNSLIYLISEGYVIYPLLYDTLNRRYYVETNIK